MHNITRDIYTLLYILRKKTVFRKGGQTQYNHVK